LNKFPGKTSITHRYCHDKFQENYFNTLGGAYIEKFTTLQNGDIIQLNIWDTAGDERFSKLAF
jgi:GTPase SAR1 family protein